MKITQMKITDIIAKLEKRGEVKDNEYRLYQNCALKMLAHLRELDPNIIVRCGGDCTHTGDHYPVDDDGNIHFDKKRFFREGEAFPDDDFIWIPTP